MLVCAPNIKKFLIVILLFLYSVCQHKSSILIKYNLGAEHGRDMWDVLFKFFYIHQIKFCPMLVGVFKIGPIRLQIHHVLPW